MMHTPIQVERYLLMHKTERHLLIQYHDQRDTITSIIIPNGYHSKEIYNIMICWYKRDTDANKKGQ